jgi:hypothetical protein
MKSVTDMLGLELSCICSYSFRQGQEHRTTLQLMQLQFTGMCISTFSFWMELWYFSNNLFFKINSFDHAMQLDAAKPLC